MNGVGALAQDGGAFSPPIARWLTTRERAAVRSDHESRRIGPDESRSQSDGTDSGAASSTTSSLQRPVGHGHASHRLVYPVRLLPLPSRTSRPRSLSGDPDQRL
jgi:hypothetical protein